MRTTFDGGAGKTAQPHHARTRGCTAARPRRTLLLAVCTAGTLALASPAALAQTFDESSLNALNEICFGPNAGAIAKTPELDAFCNNQPSGVFSSPASGTARSVVSTTVEQRLQSVREAEEERREAGRTGRAHADSGSRLFASNGQLQLPPAGGAAPEIMVTPVTGFSLFLASGATFLHHRNNRYEDGYEGTLPAVTLGGDYWIAPRLLIGLAMNYTNYDASYDNGGGFDKNIFGPELYASLLPFDGAFVDLVLGYARSENDNKRRINLPLADGTVFRGQTFADFGENLYSAALLAGYDHPIENFTVGPRLGLQYAYSQVNAFSEDGDTGLELRYSGLDRSSIQSSLGALASVVLRTSWGALVPQVSAAWVHEYADGARNVDAEYVDASPSPRFRFKREKVARDWATVGAGVVAQIGAGLQPFASFTTMQGNENFVTYGGSIGLRKSF